MEEKDSVERTWVDMFIIRICQFLQDDTKYMKRSGFGLSAYAVRCIAIACCTASGAGWSGFLEYVC